MQLEQPNPADDICTVQLQGSQPDCYKALLQILQHAATAHSSDQWKDARRDAAVWQIQEQASSKSGHARTCNAEQSKQVLCNIHHCITTCMPIQPCCTP